MKREFIRNILNVEVDGLRCINHYTITKAYNVIGDAGVADYEEEIIDQFDYSWDLINQEGGVGKVHAEIKELYNTTDLKEDA